MNKTRIIVAGLFAATALASTSAMADCASMASQISFAKGFSTGITEKAPLGKPAAGLTAFSALQAAANIAAAVPSGGFGLPMWVTLVDETGTVCAVTTAKGFGDVAGDGNNVAWSTSFTQKESGKTGVGGTNASANGASNSQWLGSRVISAQKANTANAFSIDGYSISTANLYNLVQGADAAHTGDTKGGSLYGLQHSNPVDASKVYAGLGKAFGTSKDPMAAGKVRPGGVNVFGGGLALYNAAGKKIGAVGVSGDTSCRDHAFAWEVRKALAMDHVPTGLTGGAKGDEMVFTDGSAIEHPNCPSTVEGEWSIH